MFDTNSFFQRTRVASNVSYDDVSKLLISAEEVEKFSPIKTLVMQIAEIHRKSGFFSFFSHNNNSDLDNRFNTYLINVKNSLKQSPINAEQLYANLVEWISFFQSNRQQLKQNNKPAITASQEEAIKHKIMELGNVFAKAAIPKKMPPTPKNR